MSKEQQLTMDFIAALKIAIATLCVSIECYDECCIRQKERENRLTFSIFFDICAYDDVVSECTIATARH